MAMSYVYGVLAPTLSKVSSSQSDASLALFSPSDLFQCRSACASPASSSSSTGAPGACEVLPKSRRCSRTYGNVLGQSRRRIGVKVAAAGGEEEESRESVSLDDLDKQLKIFESRESSAPRRIPVPQRIPGVSRDQPNSENGSSQKYQFPDLSNEFFAYAGIGLLLLTVVNNVLYSVFVGPGVDRSLPYKTSVPYEPRYRVTTLQQEKEAREAREANEAQQKELAAQSSEAPPP